MAKLLGFEPSIKLEVEFTGLELLYLYAAAKTHYDGVCKATVGMADARQGTYNGTLIRAMWNLGQEGLVFFSDRRDEFYRSDEEYLYENREEVSRIILTSREVDTLAKVSEGFDLLSRGQNPTIIDGVDFDPDLAARLYMSLRATLQAANIQQEILNEQEALRRESFKEANNLPSTLSYNAN